MPKKKEDKVSASLLQMMNFEDEPAQNKGGYRRRFTKYDAYSEEQEKDETPRIATEALLSVEKFEGSILEPCAGFGGVSKVLLEAGHNVTSKDLVKKVDFVKQQNFFDETELWGNVVGAPPFKIAGQFAYHAIHHVHRKVAFLLRGTFLENRARYKLLFANPELPYFEKVYIFIDRLPIGEANMVMYAWFIWNKEFRGEPTIHWL